MATLHTSTGADLGPGINVSLAEVDAKLRARGHTARDLTYTAGDEAQQIRPVTQWREYLLLRVYDNDEKTTLFAEAGFYHLRGFNIRDADFLLGAAEDDPP